MNSIDDMIHDIEQIAQSPADEDERLARARQLASGLCADVIRTYDGNLDSEIAVKSVLVAFRDALAAAAARGGTTETGEIFRTLSQEV